MVPKKGPSKRSNVKRKRSVQRPAPRERQGTLRTRPPTAPIRDATTESDEDFQLSLPRATIDPPAKKRKSVVATSDETSLANIEDILKGLPHPAADSLEGRLRKSDVAAYQRLRLHQALMYVVSGAVPS